MSICHKILNDVLRDNEFAMAKIECFLREQDRYTSQEKAAELRKTISHFTYKNYRLADMLADLKELERKWNLG